MRPPIDALACAKRDLLTAGGAYPVDGDFLDGIGPSTVTELAEWTLSAEKVAVF